MWIGLQRTAVCRRRSSDRIGRATSDDSVPRSSGIGGDRADRLGRNAEHQAHSDHARNAFRNAGQPLYLRTMPTAPPLSRRVLQEQVTTHSAPARVSRGTTDIPTEPLRYGSAPDRLDEESEDEQPGGHSTSSLAVRSSLTEQDQPKEAGRRGGCAKDLLATDW